MIRLLPAVQLACRAYSTLAECAPNAIIAFGANEGNRLQAITEALRAFRASGVEIVRYSRLYESAAAYVTEQPRFLNGAVAVQTSLTPEDLLTTLKQFEAHAGRNFAGLRFGPRPLDLDIIAYGPDLSTTVETQNLQIPHPRWRERHFVIAPIADLFAKSEVFSTRAGILEAAQLLWEQSGGTQRVENPDLRCVIPLGRSGRYLHWQGKTLVMGILNVTPDSFSGGLEDLGNVQEQLQTVKDMVHDGADIIDIGGQSTRPGACLLSAKEELQRVLPIIRAVRSDRTTSDVVLSIDTFHSKVAVAAVEAGADIINDVSAGRFDSNMYMEVARLGAAYIMMHMRSLPRDMQSKENTTYEPNETAITIAGELQESIAQAVNAGVEPWRIIVDPGVGFAKSVEGNCEILRDLKDFQLHLEGCMQRQPILVGTSRKSFLGKLTGVLEATDRDLASAVAMTLSVVGGANIVRVHNVKAGVQTAQIIDSVLHRNQS